MSYELHADPVLFACNCTELRRARKDDVQAYDSDEALEAKPTGPATKLLGGKDVMYVGKGNYVRDDASKYPTKDGLSGGFAGGERGVQKFASDGELEFDESNRPQVRLHVQVCHTGT